jgi:L-aspartate semialdehyde sulfurtransferase ferredoxin
MNMAERKLLLTFSSELVSSPITFRAARDFDLEISILRAEVNEEGGRLIVSLKGDEGNIQGAIAYMESNKVQVGEVIRLLVKDVSKCTDCSMCVSICPVKAYHLDRTTWEVRFAQERCIACGMCVDACPAGALSIKNPLTQMV